MKYECSGLEEMDLMNSSKSFIVLNTVTEISWYNLW